jgi:hypothetical protein
MYMVKHRHSILILEKDGVAVPVDSNLIEREIPDLAAVLPRAGAQISDEVAARIIQAEIDRAQASIESEREFVRTLRAFLPDPTLPRAA